MLWLRRLHDYRPPFALRSTPASCGISWLQLWVYPSNECMALISCVAKRGGERSYLGGWSRGLTCNRPSFVWAALCAGPTRPASGGVLCSAATPSRSTFMVTVVAGCGRPLCLSGEWTGPSLSDSRETLTISTPSIAIRLTAKRLPPCRETGFAVMVWPLVGSRSTLQRPSMMALTAYIHD